MKVQETNILKQQEKTCFFCGNGHNSRKWKFYTHGYQAAHWVCKPCIELRFGGSPETVVEALEKIPLPQSKLNFFKTTTVPENTTSRVSSNKNQSNTLEGGKNE